MFGPAKVACLVVSTMANGDHPKAAGCPHGCHWPVVAQSSSVIIFEFCLLATVHIRETDTSFKFTTRYEPTSSARNDDFFGQAHRAKAF